MPDPAPHRRIPASNETVLFGDGRFSITIKPIGETGCLAEWTCEGCYAIARVPGTFTSADEARAEVKKIIAAHQCPAAGIEQAE
jgi:hypothetical protein